MTTHTRNARRSRSAVLILALLVALLATTVALAQDIRSPEIVGGQEADPGEWPWQVALVKKGSDLYNNQFCGGTIIAGTWVVTAAHCVEDSSTGDLDVVAGIHDLSNPGANIQRRTLAEIIIHPGWNTDTNDNDIALLRLSSPINERPAGSGTLPIQYADLVPKNVGDLVGANMTVTGWGNRAANPPGGNDFPSRLHEVVVPGISNADCNTAYGGGITANMLCAGYPQGGKDSCQGDSGGPLVHNNSGTWQLAGVVSFGIGCANPNYPGVYARVSRYIDWINAETAPPITPTNWYFFPVVLDVAQAPPPPPPPPPAGFVNGNFEAGRVSWDEYSAKFDYLITNDFQGVIPGAHGGTWGAWLGGTNDETSVLSQRVTVPAATPLLSFYHWIGSADVCGYDWATVYVDGENVKEYTMCGTTATGGWVRQTVNLSAYAGQSVLVEFVAENDGSSNSNWFIDDVSFASSAATSAGETAAPDAPAGDAAAPRGE